MTQFATREDQAANDLEAWRLANAEEAEHREARMNAKQRHVEMMITALDAKVQQLEQLAYCQSVLLAEQGAKIADLQAALGAWDNARPLAEVIEEQANARQLAQRAALYPAFRTI